MSALFFHFNLLRVLSAVGKEAAPFRTLEPCRYLSLPLRPGNQGTQIEKTWTLIPFWPACVAWRTGAAGWIGGNENLGIAWGFDEYETEEAWQTNSGNQLIQLWFQMIWDCFHLWWFMMIYDFRVQFWIFVWYPVASFSGWQYLGTPRISVPPGTTVLEPGHWWQRPIHAAWLDVDHSRHFPRNHRNI